MTASARGDVVIVGGGIVGMVTAYYLAKAVVPSVVIERDAIGSHASGYAYGGLSPVSGFGIPGPLAEVSQEGMRRLMSWRPTTAGTPSERARIAV